MELCIKRSHRQALTLKPHSLSTRPRAAKANADAETDHRSSLVRYIPAFPTFPTAGALALDLWTAATITWCLAWSSLRLSNLFCILRVPQCYSQASRTVSDRQRVARRHTNCIYLLPPSLQELSINGYPWSFCRAVRALICPVHPAIKSYHRSGT